MDGNRRPLAWSARNYLYFRPRSLSEAIDNLSRHGGQILSGGTDFFPALGDRPLPSAIVDISGVAELRGISTDDEYVRIGGLTTWTEILRTPLPRCFDALKAAAREVGSIQIQNRGTIAGNLCNASPAADGVPPLLALNAEVELVSSEGTRRVPLGDFLLGNRKTVRHPDEVLTAVVIPRELEDARSAFLKLGARRYLVISIAMVAAVLKSDASGLVAQARVAVGSCSVIARRLVHLENGLIGAPAGPGIGNVVLAEHLSVLSPIDDVRAPAAYRQDAALTLVRRTLEACVEAA
ncbi:MAG TPA: xanthine dehydrogenase family protein subunit M [Terriglobales bacterium]|nr:xanthine dehydrogenase family protein subunit M [Terriglobales bacterium]